MQNFHNNSKRHYPSKQKTFLAFLIAFLKCPWNLEPFEKKDEFASLIISEIIDSEKPGYFRTPFGKERVNGFRTLLKSAWHHYYPIFSWIRCIFSWKKSALIWTEMLRLFVNTLTADDQYSRSIMQKLVQEFQTPLSQKKKTFSAFLMEFVKCAWNLEYFF